MNIAGVIDRKRFGFGRVFWITAAVYLFFLVVGLIAMYLTPTMNKDVNWRRIIAPESIASQGFSLAFFATFYYFSLNVFYRYISSKAKAADYIPAVVISFLALAGYYAVNVFVFESMKLEISIREGGAPQQLTAGVMIFSYTLSSLFTIGFSLLIAYLVYLRDEKKQRKILEEQKLQLEMEKSQANYNFLKAQINPHFLHNTLNFLYAKSLPYSTELSEGILTLSEIMRYALSPATTDGKVLLKDEVEHVRNVVKINQLRFSNQLNVCLKISGVLNGARIIPFLLITIVENAFKHGDLKSREHPIEIRLAVDDQSLSFYCRNKKKHGPKEISTGIGLDNIKKQLALAYGNDFSLIIEDDTEFYTTQLTISRL